jgi:hypothetical protein
VSASIIATVVSAVTFVSVPAAVFADGGDLTYFQVILGLGCRQGRDRQAACDAVLLEPRR